MGTIPYEAKYFLQEIGYNFLPNEMGAAFGNAQLEKLERFKEIRKRNFNVLLDFFRRFEKFFILPKQDPRVKTQWLAFPLTIKNDAPFTRLELVTYLEKNNIQTRPIFTGNILRQPGFRSIPHRITKNGCPVTDNIMERGFVVGCHHGLRQEHLKKLKKVFNLFLDKYS